MSGAKIIDRADQIHAVLHVNVRRASGRPRRVSDAKRSRNVALSRSMEAVLITPSPCEWRHSVATRPACPR